MKHAFLVAISLPLWAIISTQAHADFQSPSGNVVCSSNVENNPRGGVICTLKEITNATPPLPRPKDCDFDWGQMFGVDKVGKARMKCFSDFPYDNHPTVLNYGQTLKGKTYECTSQTTGMTCKNNSGHGFTLSKDTQRLF